MCKFNVQFGLFIISFNAQWPITGHFLSYRLPLSPLCVAWYEWFPFDIKSSQLVSDKLSQPLTYTKTVISQRATLFSDQMDVDKYIFLFFSHLKVNSDIICVTSKINLSLENSLVRLCSPVSPSCRGQKSCFPADLRLIKGWRQDLGGWICSLVCQFVCNENSNMFFF